MKQARLGKILKTDGKAIIAALDHASVQGPVEGLVNPKATIEKLIIGGADAILTSYGTAAAFNDVFNHIGLIVRVDGGTTPSGDDWKQDINLLFNVEDALKIGADGVIAMGMVGKGESKILSYLSHLGSQCNEWGVPLVAETFPIVDEKISFQSEHVAHAARVAIECGADIIKTVYTGDENSFREVVKGCYKPVFMLGGSKNDDEEHLLISVRDAMNAGAAGVIMGRNLWQHNKVENITKAVASIIHEDCSVAQALKIIRNG